MTLPLSLPGVAAGALLCFIPIVGEFVIPDLLGGSQQPDDRADAVDRNSSPTATGRWPRAIAVALLALLVVPIVLYERLQTPPIGGVALMRRTSTFNIVAVALGLAFLYLPIAILVIYSFNASRLVTVWGGWSLAWYRELLHDDAMRQAAWISLRVAALSATAATVLGTCAARRAHALRRASAAGCCSPAWSMRRW